MNALPSHQSKIALDEECSNTKWLSKLHYNILMLTKTRWKYSIVAPKRFFTFLMPRRPFYDKPDSLKCLRKEKIKSKFNSTFYSSIFLRNYSHVRVANEFNWKSQITFDITVDLVSLLLVFSRKIRCKTMVCLELR